MIHDEGEVVLPFLKPTRLLIEIAERAQRAADLRDALMRQEVVERTPDVADLLAELNELYSVSQLAKVLRLSIQKIDIICGALCEYGLMFRRILLKARFTELAEKFVDVVPVFSSAPRQRLVDQYVEAGQIDPGDVVGGVSAESAGEDR